MFSKTLDHDATTLLPNEADVVKLALAMEREPQDLENVTHNKCYT